ncbi:MAG: Ig-like domain-containing protein [Candidatus Berkelbacteria bacterium]|nr:MAG: Ig-like domain-containing protein [Candidatus Berkelbacteria bacterium]QQG51527.1 MAG: Ig-like domain-containing protein [Candidatus Berkelbacteria bacterium]
MVLTLRVLLTYSLALIFVPTALAQTNSVVNANVVSSVSATNSSFVADLAELPADGTSMVTLTATIVDANNLPLPQKEVIVTSNRGDIDTIRCYAGSTLTEENKATTDTNGVARCGARSLVPGEATFTATADTVILEDKPVVKFTPLPILTQLKITVKTPGGGQVTLVQPPAPSATPSSPTGEGLDHSPSSDKLVDTGINLQIPFWVFIITALFFLLIPVLLLIIIVLIRKIRLMIGAARKHAEAEEALLAKIYTLEQQVAQEQHAVTAQAQQVTVANEKLTDKIDQVSDQLSSNINGMSQTTSEAVTPTILETPSAPEVPPSEPQA